MPRMEKSPFDELVEELFKTSPKSEKEREKEKQKAMKDLALTNKQLFDAHIKVGFTPEQAIQLVAAGNMR